MTEKQKPIMNYSSFRQSMDEQNQPINSHSQRLGSIAVDYVPSSTVSSPKRRCPSTINEQSDLFSNNQHLMYHQTTLPVPIIRTSQKRSAEADAYLQDYHQHVNKRTRYDQSNSIELENQPPSTTTKRRSLFLCHSRPDWNSVPIQNDIPSFFNPLLPALSTYQRMNHLPYQEYESNLSNHFSSRDLHTEHLASPHLHMFGNNTLTTSAQKSTFPKLSMNIVNNSTRLLPPQSNTTSPLRTTNFVLDSKQQTMSATIMRTGNISPAHSDTSTESTSTCSSDEQQFHQHFPSFHYQPSRSYRERENYEQLLDLAEKLSDPNRFNQVDIEQFLSYRYKTLANTSTKTTTTTTIDILSSKQTACVICMSHFKNGQRIRVLPCQHEYHSKCIARWFTMNSSCPICRRDNFLSTC